MYMTDIMLPRAVKEKLVHVLIMPHFLYCIELYSGTSVNSRLLMMFSKIYKYRTLYFL